MADPTFSIITPFHIHSQERGAKFIRCIDSVKNQTYSVAGSQEGLWEHLVINDGSTCEFTLPEYSWLRSFEQPHLERLIASNVGLENAKNEWFVFLDSDDMLSPYYLEACAAMINQNPDYKVFNFGSVHFHNNYLVSNRGAFKPLELEKGHEFFGGGNIVNGTFIFHRECYEKLGGFPHETNPWDFSAKAQEEFPELKTLYFIINEDNPQGVVREIGNPVGNDYYYFLKLTREYHSKPFDVPLYMVFGKGNREL